MNTHCGIDTAKQWGEIRGGIKMNTQILEKYGK